MKILIIEDDKFYAKNLKKEIIKHLHFQVDLAFNVGEVEELDLTIYDLIISDIFMENYDENYIKENIIPLKIPLILITAFPDKILKEKLSKLNILDFIIKTESNRFSQIIDKLKILNYNKKNACLIVDDSKTARLINRLSLTKHYPWMEIVTAENGIEGLEKLKQHKNIKLILTDYEMPQMDGMEFIKKVREIYNLNEKIIIAISSKNDVSTSSTMLKIGANDFLTKPFVDEELICRCDNNFKIAILLDEVKELAYKDSLTSLYNRRYFFEIANKMFLSALRNQKSISILMCDIDHFKKINDTYGHDIGDIVIKHTAKTLLENVRKNDVVCRYGGEEFVIFLFDCNIENAYIVGEKIRRKIENTKITIKEKTLQYTISIGISNEGNSVEEIIKNSDLKLYEAKKTRNTVVI